MESKEIKLVATDLDGTLLMPDSSLPPHFWDIAAQLDARSILFVPASGRHMSTLEHMFAPLKEKTAFIAENGSYIKLRGKEVASRTLSPQFVTNCLAFLSSHIAKGSPLHLVASGKEAAWVTDPTPTFLKEVSKYYRRNHVIPSFDDIPEPIIKIAIYAQDAARDALPLCEKFNDHHCVVLSGQNWVDIGVTGIDKGTALHAIQETLEITDMQTLVFGDYKNDLGLFRYAEHSFAVSNAHPDVKRQARYLAPSNDEAGVLRTLIKFLNLTPPASH